MRLALDRAGDGCHRRHGFDGIIARGGFGREHDRIRAFEDGRRDVGNFGAGRNRRRDHRFQHLRGNDHRLAGAAAGADQLLLDAGNRFKRHFDTEVAASHHQRIGKLDDFLDTLDGLRFLDLRHQADAAMGDLANLCEVFRALDEGQRHPVDFIGCKNGIEVDAVLLGQRADAKQRIGQADALAVGNLRTGNNGRDDALAVALLGAQSELAVIDQQAMAGLDRFENFRMRQEDARVVAGRILIVERKRLAGLEIDLALGKLADAQLGTLQVSENADRTTTAAFDGANALDQRAHQIMAGMAHVDAEQVCPGLMKLLDHLLGGGSRTERCEDFDFSVSSHQFWLSWLPGVSES